MEYFPVVMEIQLADAFGVRYQLPKLVSCHLKRLVLYGVYLEHSRRLLQKSPNLKKLTMQNFWYDEEMEVQMTNKEMVNTMRAAVGPIEFPMLENVRTLLLDYCDLRDNFRLLRHFLRSSPNLEKLTVRLCKLPKVFLGGKGKAKSRKTYSQKLVGFKGQKLKSTEIIYMNGSKTQGLVSLFLGISDSAPKNTITFTKYEEDWA
ncbi:unnamed protein product [Urochloa humidicola]